MNRGIKNPVGTNVLATPVYEIVKKKRLKVFTDSEIADMMKKSSSGIITAEESVDFYEEYEEKVETNVVQVVDVGREVTLHIDENKYYVVNKKATPLSFNGIEYLIIRQEDFLIEVER